MRCAYLYLSLGNSLGIQRRLQGQALAAQELGLKLDFLVLNQDHNRKEGNILFRKAPFVGFARSFLKPEIFHRLTLILRSGFLTAYDVIILRYPGLPFAPMNILDKVGPKFITEHHTNEVGEYLSSGKLSHRILALLETIWGRRLLSRVKGIIGVTDEIRRFELGRSGSKPSIVISNGIHVEATPLSKFVPFNERELNLLATPSEPVPWNGIDRLIAGLACYRGQKKINLFLVGTIGPDLTELCRSICNPRINIEILGKKVGREFDAYCERSTIAISTLGLFRKGMREACSLKTREYVARGIPFIYAYDDSDLNGREAFALKLKNEDSPVDIEQVINFARKVSAIPELSEQMRQFAHINLDWKRKVRQMYDFALTFTANATT